MTLQDKLAKAQEIVYKTMAEVDNEKAEEYLAKAYRAIGQAKRELRRQGASE